MPTLQDDHLWLKQRVLREVVAPFQAPEAPRYSFNLTSCVDTLFRMLSHRVSDPTLVDAGRQCLEALARAARGDLGNLANRCEPFAKMLLDLVNPKLLTELRQKRTRGVSFAPVLLALGLADNSTLSAEPAESRRGKPRFAEYVGRVYVARNATAHEAAESDASEAASVFKGVCVFLVFAVAEYRERIERAMLIERNREQLQALRAHFGKWAPRYVDIHGRESITENFAGVDPLASELIDDPSASIGQDEDEDYALSDDAQRAARSGRVVDLIAEIPRIVFLGEAGAGKTTTLQYLAWRLIHELLENPAEATAFPVYVALNRCGPEPGNSLSELIARTTAVSSEEDIALLAARPLFLFDGLNEVRAGYLDTIVRELRELMQREELRVIVTSRPGFYRNHLSCPTFELQRLTDSQMEELLHKHFPSAENVAAFAAVLRKQPKLWEWGRNPLMLAMLARLGLRREGNLPGNRGRLMEAFIRDILRREELQKHQYFEEPLKIQLLAGLAFETRKAGQVAFDFTQACQILRERADSLGSRADIPGFLCEVADNNLLIREPVGAMGFTHEMYQEYFAAVEIENRAKADRSFPLTLEADTFWEEPLVLFSGITAAREEFIRGVSAQNPLVAARSLMSTLNVEESLRLGVSAAARHTAAQFSDADAAAKALVALVEIGDFDGLGGVLERIEKPKKQHRKAIQSAISQASSGQVLDLLASIERKRHRTLLEWAITATIQCGVLRLSPPKATLSLCFLDQLAARGLVDTERAIELFRTFGFSERVHAEKLLCAADSAFCQALERVRVTGNKLRIAPVEAARGLARDFGLESVFRPEERVREFFSANKLAGFHLMLELIGEECLHEMIHVLMTDDDVGNRAFALAVIWTRGLQERLDTTALAKSVFDDSLTVGRLQRVVRLLWRHGQLDLHASSIREQLSNLIRADGGNVAYFEAKLSKECAYLGIQLPSSLAPSPSTVPAVGEVSSTTAQPVASAVEGGFEETVADAIKQFVHEQICEHQNRIEEIVWRRELTRIGCRTIGTVTSVTPTNIVVQIDDNIEGMIHVSETFETRTQGHGSIVVGQEIDVVVVSVTEHEQRIVLRVCQRQSDAWNEIERCYRSGEQIKGIVRRITSFGAFVELEIGLTGLIHISEIADEHIDKVDDFLGIGREIEVRVIKVNKSLDRISLSMRPTRQRPALHPPDRR